jgi:anti-sigma factor RsiW
MKCENLREQFMEVVLSGPEAAPAEVLEHLRTCTACAQELASYRQTMALLDEWPAPEPSPYFSPRLRARVRDEAALQPAGWLAWLRRPLAAATAMALVAVGVSLLEVGNFSRDSNTIANNGDAVLRNVNNSASSAVSDLQYLDKNAELFSEFDALDGQSSTE